MTAALSREQIEHVRNELHDSTNISSWLVDALCDMAEASIALEPVITNSMAYAFHRTMSDGCLSADDLEEIKIGLRAAFCNIAAPVPAVPADMVMKPVEAWAIVGPDGVVQHGSNADCPQNSWACWVRPYTDAEVLKRQQQGYRCVRVVVGPVNGAPEENFAASLDCQLYAHEPPADAAPRSLADFETSCPWCDFEARKPHQARCPFSHANMAEQIRMMRVDALRSRPAEALPSNGDIYDALTEQAKRRTSTENIADVVYALHRIDAHLKESE